MMTNNPFPRTFLNIATGLITALSVGLAPGAALANDQVAFPRLGPQGVTMPIADYSQTDAPRVPLFLVKSRGGSKGRGRGARSGRSGKSAHGGYRRRGKSRAGRSYRGDWNKGRARARQRYSKRRHHRPFRNFRGRVEECYTGRLIFPDRYACGHPYNYYYGK